MGQGVTKGPYRPPPAHACEVIEMPVPVDGTTRVFWRIHVYKGRVVDYSIEQHQRDSPDESWDVVYRADTSKGTLHEHVFTRSGGQVARNVEALIPEQDWTGWDVVDASWVRVLDDVLDSLEERRRRWDQ